ncbi:MAG: hypothetical protein ACRBFS_19370 [Aureispira sp.]
MCGCDVGLYGHDYDEPDYIGGFEDLQPNTLVKAAVFIASSSGGVIAASQAEKFLTLNKDGTPKTKGFLATPADEDKRDYAFIGTGVLTAGLGLVSNGKVGDWLFGFGVGWGGYGANRLLAKKAPKLLYIPAAAPAVSGYETMQRNPTRNVLHGFNSSIEEMMQDAEQMPVTNPIHKTAKKEEVYQEYFG